MRAVSMLQGSRIASATALVGAALLLAPPPAVADDDDDWRGGRRGWYDRGHGPRGYGRPHVHHDHCEHRDWRPPRKAKRHRHYAPPVYTYAPRPYRPRPYVYYVPTPPRPHLHYYCEPCHHWYGSQVSFHSHVHTQHGVAPGLIQGILIGTVFGAMFAGN